ncbi:MAG: glycosyltransferase [Myxococcota bacterium]|nr:glycosyltransferase [Myxococcota bacterium]
MSLPQGAAVLVVGRFHVDSVGLHIAETFEAMGYPVVRFETTFRAVSEASRLRKRVEAVRTRLTDLTSGLPIARERFSKRLEATARSRPIGLTVVTHDYLDPNQVDLVRDATGAPVALWFPDHVGRFGRAWFLNARYDGLFLKEPFAVQNLERMLGKAIYYLPEAFNPKLHDAPPLSDADRAEFGCDICTAGNLYTYRAEFFARLTDYDVRIWGNPAPLWMHTGTIQSMVQNRYVVNADKARAFRAAKICVNNLNPAEVWGVNARTFELAGIGGFQLVDWRPALEDLFLDGEELVSFRDMDDLRSKIDHYLVRDSERQTIAARGRARAQRDHTFERRLQLLIDTVLGEASGYPLPNIEITRR